MPYGSPRPGGGRMPDPSSESFQKRAAGLFALPASGYKRPHPKFPLPRFSVMQVIVDEDGRRYRQVDQEASDEWNAREKTVWDELWRLPQGFAWSRPPYKYLQKTVALYVRQYVLCESSDAKAADRTTLCRYADTIGLTPQGLRLNGWIIVDDTEKPKKKRKDAPSGNVIAFPDPRDEWEDMQ